jgi:hypothetical protein
VQTLALSVLSKAFDASHLREILYSSGKLIKGEGKSVDLRVESFAVSRITGTDGMVISG